MPPPVERESELLAAINRDLPPDVDWKQGAVTYLRDLLEHQGESAELYHLIKPFIGGPDYRPFFEDTFLFLDVLERLRLPARSRVVDVACGPGWTALWMAKLGYDVVGLDISTDLLAFAERRVAAEPFPTYPGQPLDVEFVEHDIEAAPLPAGRPADAALFESALHHFLDPVAALRNVRRSMRSGGLVAIIEAARPSEDALPDPQALELMERYHTLERPYTRDQLQEILRLAGFAEMEFLEPLNGLFPKTSAVAAEVADRLVRPSPLNLVLASDTAESLAQIGLGCERGAPVWGSGFHGEETAAGYSFRWAGPRAVLGVTDLSRLRLRLSSIGARLPLTVRLVVNGSDRAVVSLTGEQGAAVVALDIGADEDEVVVESDSCFVPRWSGSPDERLLSVQVSIEEAA